MGLPFFGQVSKIGAHLKNEGKSLCVFQSVLQSVSVLLLVLNNLLALAPRLRHGVIAQA
jgi:hypothetical protein